MLVFPASDALAQDHLDPESGVVNAPDYRWDYAKKIRQVLLKDAAPYHLAAMACLPSFEPEWVVTLVRDEEKNNAMKPSYYVEYVGAKALLHDRKDYLKVKVVKTRVKLFQETAEALNKTWREMMLTTRYPSQPVGGTDGVEYHFSRFVPRPGRDPLAGWEEGIHPVT